MGDRFSVAWRVLDAQYWSLAQRRKRIFLVADFGGRTAPKILFESDRLPGYPTESDGSGQRASPDTPESAGASGGIFGTVTMGFSAGQGAKAGGIGYSPECAPTLKGSESGTNMVPSILCLNDQGGRQMDCSESVTGTLRSQEHGHQPVVFENHGIDARYTGPLEKAPTVTARFGTGGNNVPLAMSQSETYAIAGNIIDRKDKNGGNGIGVQKDVSYTLTSTDQHCVFSQQRSDIYTQNNVVSTQSARQYKDATDLVCSSEVAGVDCRSGTENGNLCGTLQSHSSGGYSLNTLHPVRVGKYVRRLTPLECERLMGFPDGWTNLKGATDSARYRALGNSVAIPCVEFVLRGIAYFLRKSQDSGGDE